MLLKFDNEEPFATGAASYDCIPVPGSDDTNRILVHVEVDDELKQAVLDTGGQYFFCTQELTKSIMASPKELLGPKKMQLKGIDVEGNLCLIAVTLLRDEGEPLTFQATAFLPNLDQEFSPSFLPYPYLGLHGCMERVRFAIDPSRNEDRLYFGECSG